MVRTARYSSTCATCIAQQPCSMCPTLAIVAQHCLTTIYCLAWLTLWLHKSCKLLSSYHGMLKLGAVHSTQRLTYFGLVQTSSAVVMKCLRHAVLQACPAQDTQAFSYMLSTAQMPRGLQEQAWGLRK